MSDKEARNDNFNSNHIHADKGVHVVGWIVVILLVALGYAEDREQTTDINDLKKERLLKDAYEWEQLTKDLEQCRASSTR
jgi:predicted histidine transporter YuiF (NhaC family)